LLHFGNFFAAENFTYSEVILILSKTQNMLMQIWQMFGFVNNLLLLLRLLTDTLPLTAENKNIILP